MDAELREFLMGMEQRLMARFDALSQRVDKLEQRMDRLEERMDRLEQRMDTLEQRVDMLEQRMDATDQRFESFQQEMEAMLARFGKEILDSVDLKVRQVIAEINQYGREWRDVRETVTGLDGRVLLHERRLNRHTNKIAMVEEQVALMQEM
ncbi:MAG: hypothetical protein K6T81_19375 [Alicyclobacillus macrosporangiidus]|uniref:hypothetical protein n=1 Tax=Alicyclobacillus macrosporangiidus TaxID=392015 RepID=UPI0026ED0FB4|nr:hypothetical protein [Alicyclobacillus macrosporangiidus]MCL6600871.1 hypothetical protein [Alicyclobacillus macrosporangiidus]